MSDFDPVKFFLLGRQARVQEEALKGEQIKRSMLEQIPGARAQYFEGNGSALQQLAPDEWSQLETHRVSRAAAQDKAAADTTERARQKNLYEAQGMLGALTETQRSPQAWPRLVAILEGTGRAERGSLPPEPPPPEALSQMVNEQKRVISILATPEVTPMMKEALGAHGYGPGMEGSGLRDPEVQKAIADMWEASKRGKTMPQNQVQVVNQMPSAGLEKAVRGKTEQNIIDDSVLLTNLDKLDGQMKPEFLTLGGRAKAALLKGADYAGVNLSPGNVDYISQRRAAEETVGQVWNAYRQQVTGASASDSELVRLQKTTLNPDLGPSEFAASLKNFRDAVAIRLRIHRKVLREGLSLRPEEQGQMVADLAAQGEQARSPADRIARLRDLKSRNLTPKQALDQLVREGYVDDSGADGGDGG